MNTIGDILTDWQRVQMDVITARARWKESGKHEDLTAYVDALEKRDNTPFQPALF